MKPDWATRLQRTFARKYDAGFAKGLMLGKAVATRDEKERIIKLLEADRSESHAIDGLFDGVVFQTISRSEFKAGLIALIKGEK